LILSRSDIAGLMRASDWLEAVERGFRAGATGAANSPAPLHIPATDGGFHAKGASIDLGERRYAALKLNGNFPGNPERNGLPTVQGALILCDGDDGRLLALMDSIEITLRRTAAASALAARLLARPDSRNLLICGCGEQGRAHLLALAEVLPLVRCLAWDADEAKARSFAAEMDGKIRVESVERLGEAALASDAIVTCTSARRPFLNAADVAPGAFVAAVGADSGDKNELGPDLMAAATIVTDSTAQCLGMGDLRHAVQAGAARPDAVHAELGEIVAGRRPGRRAGKEIIVFDSTGTALQDVASAAMVYERALADPTLPRMALGAA
jgi:ornithine cyclodeaminase/alanine dehydrogenase-like protein (mu-crystallin family)